MPDGHHVHIPELNTVVKKIEVDEFHHMTFKYTTSIVAPKEEGRALAANIVHSIDAFVAREMIRRASNAGYPLGSIHDCFYAGANHVNDVRQNYIEILSEVASMNLVEDILSQLLSRPFIYTKISNDLPEEILKSEYALS
jgi:DNA-directed RNA polymerase